MSTVLLEAASREEGGKKIFLSSEYAALKSIPVVGATVECLLKNPESEVDARLLSLLSGTQGVDAGTNTRWIEIVVPAQSLRSGLVSSERLGDFPAAVVRVEASSAKWRNTTLKRLYRLTVSLPS